MRTVAVLRRNRNPSQGRLFTRGVVAYLLITFALTWLPTWLLGGAWLGEGYALGTRLLTGSLFYALCMGWQPIAAVAFVRRWMDPPGSLDAGLHPARARFIVLASTAPLALAAAAIGLAWLLQSFGTPSPESLHGRAEPELLTSAPSLWQALTVTAAFFATAALILAQCLGEELGWRGYFMVRLMQGFGAWRGLLLHGLAWGVWYAPVFLLGSGGLMRSALRSAAFVLTCVLLGTLLGWLRLASRSIVPTTIANVVLTLTAGLPFLLQGADVGLRGSAYGPPGWLPMAVAIALLAAAGRARAAVATPLHATWLVLVEEPATKGPRVLH